jgi:hypothetical protein
MRTPRAKRDGFECRKELRDVIPSAQPQTGMDRRSIPLSPQPSECRRGVPPDQLLLFLTSRREDGIEKAARFSLAEKLG